MWFEKHEYPWFNVMNLKIAENNEWLCIIWISFHLKWIIASFLKLEHNKSSKYLFSKTIVFFSLGETQLKKKKTFSFYSNASSILGAFLVLIVVCAFDVQSNGKAINKNKYCSYHAFGCSYSIYWSLLIPAIL